MHPKLPSESFRTEHAQIKEHLAHIEALVGSLSAAPREEQRRTMDIVVRYLKSHVHDHAEWEERMLYPVVDRQAGGGPERFTASMRREHVIVARWIGELAEQAARTPVDAVAFARRADKLLGLLEAHFEEEEEVLLPVLDRTMTPERFDGEVMSRSER